MTEHTRKRILTNTKTIKGLLYNPANWDNILILLEDINLAVKQQEEVDKGGD